MTVWQLFLAGGPFMWPILFISFAAGQMVWERWFYFRRVEGDPGILLGKIEGFLLKSDVNSAVAECERSPLAVARILKAGILRMGEPQDRIVRAMEDVACFEVPAFERGLVFLQTAAQLATLLGLAGTVAGLSRIFFSVQMKAEGMQIVGPADIAGGLGQALLTSVAGLLVAIPALLFYHYYLQKAAVMALEAEKASRYLAALLERLAEGNPAKGMDL